MGSPFEPNPAGTALQTAWCGNLNRFIIARTTDFDDADPSTTSGILETLKALRA
jgi:hypothetical protein